MKSKAVHLIIGLWLLFLLLTTLAGCKTYKVSEVVQMHDTLIVSKTDTAYISKEVILRDSFEVNTEKTVTISESGDTIRVAIYRDRWRDRNIYIHDTIYKAKTDTLHSYAASEATIEKEKQLSTWEKIKMAAGGASLVLCLFLVGVIILVITLYKKKK